MKKITFDMAFAVIGMITFLTAAGSNLYFMIQGWETYIWINIIGSCAYILFYGMLTVIFFKMYKQAAATQPIKLSQEEINNIFKKPQTAENK